MGGFREADSKHMKTGYYISEQDYEQLVGKIEKAEYEMLITRQDCERQISEAKMECQRELEHAQQIIPELQSKITMLETEVADQQSLNKNLIRICRERASAERGLRPKKSHSGFVLLDSQQKLRRGKNGREIIEEVVWQALIQTPYVTELGANQVEKLIIEDSRFTELLGEHIKVEMFLKANYRKGYWECIYSYITV